MFASIIGFFHLTIYTPLYNALIVIISALPGHDVGFAIILLTVFVRILLYPLSRRAIETQRVMKRVGPKVEEIKKKFKDDAMKQNQEVMRLYKEEGVHPLAGIGMQFIQIPIIFSLYYMFARSGLPHVSTDLLYSFVHAPTTLNMLFLGVVHMAEPHNIVLAVLVAVTQYASTRLSMGKSQDDSAIEATLSSDMAKSFDMQARYMIPLMIGVFAYFFPAAAGLYYLTFNLFMIVQELVSGRRF